MNMTLARTWALAATLALSLAPSAARAQEDDEGKGATLKPGDDAPKLVVDKWVKGEPIKALEKGKVYVIECWATWCGPCVTAIPHVTELQKKYEDKGLVVIGMNVWENDDSAVEPFVKKMGEKMDYRVATDVIPEGKESADGKMAVTWMKAAGRNGIPCSFIVDRDLKIAWIGHPMGMDKPLEQIINGKFDLKKEAERAKKEAEQAGKLEQIQQRFADAMRAEDWDKALAAVDEAMGASPEVAEGIRSTRMMILVKKKDYKAANTLAKELTEGETGKDQQMLVQVADVLLQAEDTKEIDVDLAMSAAERAAGMDGELAWAGKMLVAKGHAAKGDYAKAVELHTAAMSDVPEEAKAHFQGELDKYKAKAKESTKPGDKSKAAKEAEKGEKKDGEKKE